VRSAVGAWRSGLLALLVGMAAWAPSRGQAAEYTVGPVPAWVVPGEPGVATQAQRDKSSDGVAYLLSDSQVLAGKDRRVTYHRLVSTALNASGVESVADIEIPFDPSYQTLVLHSIDIVRDGRVIPKLASARIHVIQRETGLEARIYDGSKTLNVFLDDVRVGDTIDYAYSRIGRNPVFKGRDFGSVALQYGTPVARIRARLLVPQGGKIALAERNTTARAVVSEHDGWRDYRWEVADTPALTVEEGAPDWYSPYAEVAWSEFPDWSAVARWALPLYRPPAVLDAALGAQVERIRASASTPEARMLAALRLVQGEVRYLGIEIGQNSHAPNPPATVFARRFGDCKDKTLLTLTLLQRLGIEAHAALVNTSLRRGLADRLPAPGVFDHVLVQARIGKRSWWLDPTRETQQADLAHLYQPDYGLALVVDPHTTGLTAMKQHDAPSGARSMHVVLDARAGFDKPMRYTVETVTRGGAAESLRATLASNSRDDLQKRYLNFYANDYPHIAVAAPMQVQDDKPGNRITTRESYTITDLVKPAADGKGKVVDFYTPDIVELLRDPRVTIRKAPLQIAFPVDVSQRTEILLPETWPIKPETVTVADPAFHYERSVKLEGLHLVITQHVQTLVDEVAAADMPRYLANLERARTQTGYELWWNKPPAAAPEASGLDRMNWPVALLALGMLGFFAWLASRVYRYDPPPAGDRGNRLVGIDGWLVVLALALLLRPLVFVSSLIRLAPAMSIDRWAALTTYGHPSYNALWAPLLLFELAAAIAQLVFSLLLLVLFFRRRSSFPRAAMLLMAVSLVIRVADLMLATLLPAVTVDPRDVSQVVGGAVGVALWLAYLWQSERVKSTFVRRYRMDAPPPLPRAVPASPGEPIATVDEGG
jgi:transglutaminase-like putative cysteine protease